MPMISTELSEEELAKLQADQETMQAADLGAVMKAAIAAFKPGAPAAPPAGLGTQDDQHQG